MSGGNSPCSTTPGVATNRLIAGTTERGAAVRQIADHYLETFDGFVV